MTAKPPRRLILLVLLTAALSAGGLAGERTRGLLLASAELGLGALAIALPIGSVLAVLLVKTNVPGKRMAIWLLVSMLFIPLHLFAAAWRAGFGTLGWYTQLGAGDAPVDPLLRGMPAAVWIHGLAAVAWVALILGAALRSVDARLEQHALLSYSPLAVLGRVSFRYAAPSVLIAAGWVMIVAASEMSVTDLFQVRTFAEEVYTQHAMRALDPVDPAAPAGSFPLSEFFWGLAALWLAAVAVLLGVAGLVARVVTHSGQPPWKLPVSAGAATVVLGVLLALIVALPLGNLFYKAGGRAVREGDGWRREWSAGKAVGEIATAPVRYRRELGQSAKLGLTVATAAVLVGGAIAWRLTHGGWERTGWIALLALGLMTPGPLVGLAAIRVLNQPTDSTLWFLSWLYDRTLFAPWLVQTVRAVPLVALVLWPVWQSVPRAVLESARLDGAWGWWVAARMRAPAVAAAWLLGVALSFGELSATLLVMPPGDLTMTLQLFNLLHSGVDDRVAAISLVMLATIGLLVGAALWLFGPAAPRSRTR